MQGSVDPVPADSPTFAGFPRCADLDALAEDVAIVGVPVGVPYALDESAPAAAAPRAIRAASRRYAPYLGHHDVDFDGPLFAGRALRVVDCGDVAMAPGQYDANGRATTRAVRTILDRGALPVVLGGDNSVVIPVVRAFEAAGPICIVQIDAHLDWRDEVDGVREGLSSPMRRTSELPWVNGMVQVGLRGVGSGRAEEFAAARAFGSVVVPAAEIHRRGIVAALERIPAADRYYVTIDADGLDPAIAPGVGSPAYGGLTYFQVFDLLRGVAARGPIVGFDLVEVVPARDHADLTSTLAARLVLNLLGALAHEGRLG